MGVLTDHPVLSRALSVHPQVALRPEPFGALAYHYDTRRLVLVKHPDLVRVLTSLGDHPTVADALRACDIAPDRNASFAAAISSLLDSEMLHDRAG